jgi:hypothetical protein
MENFNNENVGGRAKFIFVVGIRLPTNRIRVKYSGDTLIIRLLA